MDGGKDRRDRAAGEIEREKEGTRVGEASAGTQSVDAVTAVTRGRHQKVRRTWCHVCVPVCECVQENIEQKENQRSTRRTKSQAKGRCNGSAADAAGPRDRRADDDHRSCPPDSTPPPPPLLLLHSLAPRHQTHGPEQEREASFSDCFAPRSLLMMGTGPKIRRRRGGERKETRAHISLARQRLRSKKRNIHAFTHNRETHTCMHGCRQSHTRT